MVIQRTPEWADLHIFFQSKFWVPNLALSEPYMYPTCIEAVDILNPAYIQLGYRAANIL